MKVRKLTMLLMVVVVMLSLTGCFGDDKDEKEVFTLQKMEGFSMEEGKIPCRILMYEKSTEAFNKPIVIYQEVNVQNPTINFSFTGEDGEVIVKVKDGIIIETNEKIPGVEKANIVGDISTFQLQMTPQSDTATILYELELKKGKKKTESRYIAFQVWPKAESQQ